MKRYLVLMSILLLAASIIMSSCASAPKESDSFEMTEPSVSTGQSIDYYEESSADYDYNTSEQGDYLSGDEERMIVRNGEMSIIVDDVVDGIDEITELTADYDGYVVSTWIYGDEQNVRGNISIRVPDEDFEEVMDRIGDLAVEVESERSDSRDVTEEYTDLESRLRNAEATEQQYLALLDRATNVEEILKIYESLSRVRREIEQIKGRMQYLEKQTSMSLIYIRLEPATTDRPLVPRGWNIVEAFKSVIRGIITFGQWFVIVLMWLLVFSPVWGTAVGIFIWRRRRKKALKAREEEEEEEA